MQLPQIPDMSAGHLVPATRDEARAAGLPDAFGTSAPAEPVTLPAGGVAVAASAPAPSPVAPAAPAPVTPAPRPPASVLAATATPGLDAPRFVGGALRAMEVPLRYPVEFAGRVWETIPLRRPTSREVGDYFEALSRIAEGDWLHFPIYAEADGTPVPGPVIDFLDPDDAEALAEAAADFLCARLRRLQVMQRSASTL